VRIILLIFFLFLIISCKKEDELITKLKENHLKNRDIKEFFKENKILLPNNISFDNPNYYYPLAKLYYDRYDFDEWSTFLFKRAFETENIFKKEAFNTYITALALNGNLAELKSIIKKYPTLISEKYTNFLISFANGDKFSNIETLPDRYEFFAIIYDMLQRDNEALKDSANQIKITKYLSQFALKNSYFKQNIDKISELLKMSDNNPLLSLIYFYITEDSENLPKYIYPSLLSIDEYELATFIKKICYRNNEKKIFFDSLEKIYLTKKSWARYLYATEIFNYRDRKFALQIVKNSLPFFREIGDYNYNIRSKILYVEYNLNPKWIEDVINLVNDYPKLYHSGTLLNLMLRSAIYQNKKNMVTPYLSKIDIQSMEEVEQGINYYLFYLIDGNDRWKNILFEKYPLSYGALTLSSKKITFNSNYYKKNVNNYTTDGKKELKKLEILLEFDLSDDAKKIEDTTLNNDEKIEYYDVFYRYYLKKEDFYNAVKYAGIYVYQIYGNSLVGVDKESLKRLFPDHFYNTVINASKEFKIEPSLIYAVMREESRYKKDIVSVANAIGLMQVIPSTGAFISPKIKLYNYDLTNPEDNIRMGTYYLKFLNDRYQDYPLILSSYNAGPGRTNSWLSLYKKFDKESMYELIPIEETRHYIRKVMRSYYIYKNLYPFEE